MVSIRYRFTTRKSNEAVGLVALRYNRVPMNHFGLILAGCFVVASVVAGCGGEEGVPTPSATASLAFANSPTVVSTPAPPTLTPVPSRTPSPTPTPAGNRIQVPRYSLNLELEIKEVGVDGQLPGPDSVDDGVGDDASAAAHDLACEPAGNDADCEPDDYVFEVRVLD